MFPLFILTIENSDERSRWESLYTMYQKYMYQIAFSILKNSEDAEDIVNQTFLKMIDNGIKLDPNDPRCKVYLGRAANNNAINLYKRNNHFSFTDIDEFADTIGFEPDLSEESELVQAIAKLPDLYKDPLILYYYGNYKPNDRQKRKLEERGQRAENITLDAGIEAYYISSGTHNTLFWYDENRDLSFDVTSNLDKDSLLACFPVINYRLPYYEPEWFPDGYEEAEHYEYYPQDIRIYRNKDNGAEIYLICTDASEYNGWTLLYSGNSSDYEEINTGSISYYYSTSDKEDSYSETIWLDEENHLAFSMQANLSKEELFRVVESIRCVE